MSTEPDSKTESRHGTPVSGPTTTSASANNVRSLSPLISPTCHSRLLEKAELQNLNDRLACYIDRVRNLETENTRLNIEMHTIQDSIERETSNLKSMYEQELTDARKLLDETSKEKAKLEIDMKRFWEENDEIKQKLDKKIKELLIAQKTANIFENRFNELTGKYNFTCGEFKRITIESKELKNENEHLQQQIDECRKNLEGETLARVDLENVIQSLQEELSFKNQIHSKQLNDTRSGCQIDLNAIDEHLNEQYEAKLQQSLRELREQYQIQMLNNREGIEKLYEAKMKNLQNIADRNDKLASATAEELKLAYNRIDGLNSRINDLVTVNNVLNARIQELEKLLETEHIRNSRDIASIGDELQHLRNEMAKQLQDYQDLMDIKVSLDLEIAAYDKLLKNEEHRLNIVSESDKNATVTSFSQLLRSKDLSPKYASHSVTSRAGNRKRKHDNSTEKNPQYIIEDSAKGDIEIFEVDPKGYFMKLRNKGKKGINIGNWKLISNCGGNKITITFHNSINIDAGGIITIWSGKTGIKNEPPKNIVIKEHWFVYENTKTILVNVAGEEVAAMEQRKLESSNGGRGLNTEASSTTNKRSGFLRFIPFF